MDAPVNAAVSELVYGDALQALRTDVQQYIYATGALKAAVGWCIGVATKEGIDRILDVSMRPLLLVISARLSTLFLRGTDGGAGRRVLKKALHITGVVLRTFIEWAVIVVVAYFALEIIFNRKIMGLSASVMNSNNQTEFATSKMVATSSNESTRQLLSHRLGQGQFDRT